MAKEFPQHSCIPEVIQKFRLVSGQKAKQVRRLVWRTDSCPEVIQKFRVVSGQRAKQVCRLVWSADSCVTQCKHFPSLYI
jgi:hypothetical protein